MGESDELDKARRCLARAEADLRSPEALAQLGDGLARLADVLDAADRAAARTARNLVNTYAARLFGRIGEAVSADPQLPEPELEHYFKVVLAFDQFATDLPPTARELKIAVVRRLIDRYYEGHPAESKREALAQLAEITGRT